MNLKYNGLHTSVVKFNISTNKWEVSYLENDVWYAEASKHTPIKDGYIEDLTEFFSGNYNFNFDMEAILYSCVYDYKSINVRIQL